LSYFFELHPDFTHFEKTLINIKEHFKTNTHTIHKARNELKIIPLEGIKTVVKAFKIPHFLNQIVYKYFRSSKAKKSFQNALKLQELGINTPTPIGYIEFYRWGLFQESFFLSKHLPYDFTIREVFHHKVDDVENILKQFSAFSYDLHQKGVWHVDYSLGNILVQKKENSYEFYLVDINRMEFRESIPPQEGLKNFNKFWPKFPDDLPIIAKEYAKLSGFDEKEAIGIIIDENEKLQQQVALKKKLKGKK